MKKFKTLITGLVLLLLIGNGVLGYPESAKVDSAVLERFNATDEVDVIILLNDEDNTQIASQNLAGMR